jgi:hypothetical protein
MSNTRFNNDPLRVQKSLQQSTDPGRWNLNVPGNGDKPCYMEDPYIIIQKWGANLRTNVLDVESDLLGINRKTHKDCLEEDNYKNHQVSSKQIKYPVCRDLSTEQSRATLPAWTFRELEQPLWSILPLNAQENTCLPFQSNLNTRILEKDSYNSKNVNNNVCWL